MVDGETIPMTNSEINEFQNNDDNIRYEIEEKVERMEEINKKLIQLGWTNKLTNYTKFNDIRTAKITALENEFNEIESYLLANYEDSLVDDILISLFM